MIAARLGMTALALWMVTPDDAARAEPAACTTFESCCPAFKDYVGNDCLVRIWPKGRIPYSYDNTIEMSERPKIRAAMDQWQTMTGGRIAFVESATDPNQVVIHGDPKGGCRSGLPGKRATGIHRVNWRTGCPYAHEAGHVIGLYHEHQRIDRDRYVTVEPSQLKCDSYYDVVKRCAITADANYGEYNIRSVMHYRVGSPRPPCYMTSKDGQCLHIPEWDQITAHDASNVLELYAHKESGWTPFRSVGRDIGETAPPSPEIATKVVADGDPALTAQRDGSINLFVRGTDGQLWHRFRVASRWSGWSPMGGSLASSPAAASFGPGSVIVAARLKKGTIGILQYASNRWRPWAEVPAPPGGAASAPALAAVGPERLDLFVRGTDNRLWRLVYDAGADRGYTSLDWVDEGGRFVSNPAAVSWGRHRIDVVVAVASRQIWHWWYSNGATGWGQIGCCIDPGSSPAIASREVGSHDVVMRDEDHRLRHQTWSSSGWSGWSPIGGILTSSPAIVATTARRIEVVAAGTDHIFKHRFWEQ